MKVLQISSSDVVGSRFNGFDIRHLLAGEGVETRHLVWNKVANDSASSRFFDVPGSRMATRVLGRIERGLSIHSRLQLQSFTLPLHRAFREADVVHYHIVHDGFFGFDALPWLSRLKPSVWTWHDPWAMTGHCIYPMECDRWKIGCGQCPALDLPFPMRRDRTAQDFRWKKKLIEKMDVDIVVASNYMRQMAEASPIGQNKRTHLIPFGVDLAKFSPQDGAEAKQRLGIDPHRLVVCVRAFPESPFKGFGFFVEALRRLGTDRHPLAVVTTHSKGHLDEFKDRHQVVDLGWLNDEQTILDTFAAADIFVMPSTAEAFGMMAIEAMASAKPIIVFEGTSLPEVTHAPEIGVAVPMADSNALGKAISRLVNDEGERRARGNAGRSVAELLYGDRMFAQRLAGLYANVAARYDDQANRSV